MIVCDMSFREAQELCNHNLGENWQREFIASVNTGGIERVLL
jgi:hypothetical protein